MKTIPNVEADIYIGHTRSAGISQLMQKRWTASASHPSCILRNPSGAMNALTSKLSLPVSEKCNVNIAACPHRGHVIAKTKPLFSRSVANRVEFGEHWQLCFLAPSIIRHYGERPRPSGVTELPIFTAIIPSSQGAHSLVNGGSHKILFRSEDPDPTSGVAVARRKSGRAASTALIGACR